MPIVTENEVAKTLRLNKLGPLGHQMTMKVMDLLKIKDLNDIYDKYCHLQGISFIDAVLKALDITVEITDSDLKRLPKNGPFIVVSNHPLGAIDGLIMLKLLLSHNEDSKIMANFLLTKIKPIENYICPVNPFEDNKKIYSSISGIKNAITHLQKGAPLGIFPAGEVSTRKNGFTGKVEDKNWEQSIMKLIRNARVPVVPVFFHARNSELFYFVSGIDARLRTASLPSEVFKGQHKKITLRIGQPISVEKQDACYDILQYTDFIRQKTYLLGSPFRQRKSLNLKNILPQPHVQDIVAPSCPHGIQRDIDQLISHGALIVESGDFQVLFTPLADYPALLTELGRLREVTFRAAGEGTNKGMDIDKYDYYYHHLILWDKKAALIAGAYRLGMGAGVFDKKGLSGFYLSELFYMSGPLSDVLKQSIEMGRAFIISAYQQRPMPLFLLWKGILSVAAIYPEYKYLIGAASISNMYSDYCKSLMVEYLRRYNFDENLSYYLAPKKPFRSVLKSADLAIFNQLEDNHLKAIDKMIEEIEPQGFKIPVLIKKYLLQNAQIVGFNVDPAFCNAIDCMMYIETSRIKMNNND